MRFLSYIVTTLLLPLAVAGCTPGVTGGGGGGNGGGGGGQPRPVVEVSMISANFQPSDIEITRGTTVVWTNESNLVHTVSGGTPEEPDDSLESGNIEPGETFQFEFTQTGTFPYYSRPFSEEGMSGTIVVVEPTFR